MYYAFFLAQIASRCAPCKTIEGEEEEEEGGGEFCWRCKERLQKNTEATIKATYAQGWPPGGGSQELTPGADPRGSAQSRKVSSDKIFPSTLRG